MKNSFSDNDLGESAELLETLFSAVCAEEGTLAGGEKVSLGPAGQVLDSLRETRISFGNPRNRLIGLTKSCLRRSGLS